MASHRDDLSRHDLTRRQLLGGLGALGALGAMATLGLGAQSLPREALPRGDMDDMAVHMPPMELPRRTIGMLVYPKMVMQDLIGPMTILKILRADIHLVWKDRRPVSNDLDLPIAANSTFEDCPSDLDVLFVPGGLMGTIALMNDTPVLDFLVDRAERARYVTSVCTGSMVLAAAGLLEGYRATSHWAVADLLPLLGAIRSDDRVVIDRNRMTGSGVTAGIDFGLDLAARLYGEEQARRVQLIVEYAPQPPFHSGTPAEAGPERVAKARSRRVWMDGQIHEAAVKAAARLGIKPVTA